MRLKRLQSITWELVRRQFGVISRRQLLELGWTSQEIQTRLERGRLHPLFRGVYAVGRPEVGREGRWMAAVLACGGGAVLSHGSAAAHWRIRPEPSGPIHISTPLGARRRQPGIHPHRRTLRAADVTEHRRIPITCVTLTLTDMAADVRGGPLEAMINQADVLGLIAVPDLRAELDEAPPRPGKRTLLTTLDRRTFAFTRSQLERAFIPIALSVGLPLPETCVVVNGFEVDFYWRELGLVVEADGITYHRTAAQQSRDRLRDQAHVAAGLTALRFTHSQIRYEPAYVRATLARVVARLLREVGREPQELGHR